MTKIHPPKWAQPSPGQAEFRVYCENAILGHAYQRSPAQLGHLAHYVGCIATCTVETGPGPFNKDLPICPACGKKLIYTEIRYV